MWPYPSNSDKFQSLSFLGIPYYLTCNNPGVNFFLGGGHIQGIYISSCKKGLPNPRCETLPTGLGSTLLIIVTLLVLSHGFGVWAYNLQFL